MAHTVRRQFRVTPPRRTGGDPSRRKYLVGGARVLSRVRPRDGLLWSVRWLVGRAVGPSGRRAGGRRPGVGRPVSGCRAPARRGRRTPVRAPARGRCVGAYGVAASSAARGG